MLCIQISKTNSLLQEIKTSVNLIIANPLKKQICRSLFGDLKVKNARVATLLKLLFLPLKLEEYSSDLEMLMLVTYSIFSSFI